MRVIGIDPGIEGAIAFFHDARLTLVVDLPVIDKRIDGGALYSMIGKLPDTVVYVENTQPMPRNGSIASFKLGLNTGIIVGVVEALQQPLVRVRPIDWKRTNGLVGKPKDAARGLCVELYPSTAHDLRRVKDHNRADAVLIARHGLFKEIHHGNSEMPAVRRSDQPNQAQADTV